LFVQEQFAKDSKEVSAPSGSKRKPKPLTTLQVGAVEEVPPCPQTVHFYDEVEIFLFSLIFIIVFHMILVQTVWK
jgi:hypothetical protein